MKGRRGKVLVALVGIGVSAVFLWLAVRNADLDAVRDALAEARPGFVLLAVAVLGVGYGFQALRWQRIANAPNLELRSFYGMLLGGLACNNVLPVRIGEFLRAGWLSRDAPMPGGRAFGSVVLDRMCDIVTLAAFFAIGLQAVASPAWLVRLAVGALVAVVAIAVALTLARVYARRHGRRGERRPRGRLVVILLETIDMLGEPHRPPPRGDVARPERVHMDVVRSLGRPRGSIARHRSEPRRGDLRHVGARTRRCDPLVAGLHRHVPVDRGRRARAARRPRRAGARVLDPHAGELVRPHDARRRRVRRNAGAARPPGSRARSRARLKEPTWRADTLRVVISVVVPLLNEEHTLETLYAEIAAALEPVADEFEVVFVDDGSTDASMSVLSRLHDEVSNVVVVHLRRNFGKAAALQAGVPRGTRRRRRHHRRRSPGRPGRDPEAPRQARRGFDLVSGWKTRRNDPLPRRLFSRIFNWTTGVISGVHLHDVNCGLKAYRAEVLRGMRLYGELHRFIPVLAAYQGYRIAEIPVNHRPRQHGSSRYGPERYLRGFFDLLSVTFMGRYRYRPLHLFGGIGLLMGAVGFVILTYLTVLWFWGRRHRQPDRSSLSAFSSWSSGSSSCLSACSPSSSRRNTRSGWASARGWSSMVEEVLR